MSSIFYYSTSRTRIDGQTKIYTLIWTVPNFLILLENKTTREFRAEESKSSAVEHPLDVGFHLKMKFWWRNNDMISIHYLSQHPAFLKSILSICLDHHDKRPIVIKEYHTVRANKWQHLATLLKQNVTSNDSKGLYLQSDGSLKLKFQFMIIDDSSMHPNMPAQLSNDFENLLNNGLFSDVTIKSVEQVEYKAHKAVLASRSTVLKAHFEHNTTECSTSIVQSPLESEVLKEVLTFIYSDKAPKINDMAEKLLAAADYYELGRLKSLCEEHLYKKLTVDNAIDILQLADLHSANTLKHLTLEFLKGVSKQITKTEGWAKLNSVVLIKRMYEYVVN